MHEMNIIPLGDRIMVRLLQPGSTPGAGRETDEPSAEQPVRGVVIAAGAGQVDHSGRTVPLTIEAGDIVLFGKHFGRECTFGGIRCWILKADDITLVETKVSMTRLRGDSNRRPS